VGPYILAEGNVSHLLLQTGWVARATLILLLIFSVFSWAIILQKYSRLKKAARQTERFLDQFRQTVKLVEPQVYGTAFRGSPLVSQYRAAYAEVESQVGVSNPHGKLKSPDAVETAARLAASAEMQRMEGRMSWLATTAGASPFIGLFGTVWGIMDAFMGLGTAGAATLRAVAPGIAEALVTTAAGLFAAIPALIAYNQFAHRIREFAIRMDDFALELRVRAEKLYT
jgi:biopolymer transport protein TolQ